MHGVPGAIVSAAWTLIWGLTVVVKDNKRFHFRNVDVIYGVDRRRTALIEVIPSQYPQSLIDIYMIYFTY